VNDIEADEFDKKLGISREAKRIPAEARSRRAQIALEEDRWGEL